MDNKRIIMITVVAEINVKNKYLKEFLKIFKANVPNVLAEDGCHGYSPMQDADSGIPIQQTNSSAVYVVEQWESLEALHTHLKAPHMETYRQKVAEMVDGVSLKVLENI